MKKLTHHPLLKKPTPASTATATKSQSLPPITLFSFGIDSLQVGVNNTNAMQPTPLVLRCEQLHSSLLRAPQLLAHLSLVNLAVVFNDSVCILQRKSVPIVTITA